MTFESIIAQSVPGRIRFWDLGQVLGEYSRIVDLSQGIIYVGANTGQEIPICKQYTSKIYAFEAIGAASVWGQLVNHADDKCVCINCALADRAGMMNMYPSSNNYESSSLLEPGTHLQEYSQVAFGDPILVPVLTLDCFSFAAQSSALIMDVQGAELKVMQGLSDWSRMNMVILEYNSDNVYKLGATFESCNEFLTERDFVYVESFGEYNNYQTGVFASNAVFLKKQILEVTK